MGRWEPDARARLAVAALDLYLERGFEQTTVADIAERAGVTERTFFRHFADKREVLFDASNTLQTGVVASIHDFADDVSPLEAATSALVTGSAFLEERAEYAARRAQAIAASPELLEREQAKLSRLAAAMADALAERGTPRLSARFAAELAVSAFGAGFERWVAPESAPNLADCIREALRDLRAVVAER